MCTNLPLYNLLILYLSYLSTWFSGSHENKAFVISVSHTHQDWPKNSQKQAFGPPVSVRWSRGVFYLLWGGRQSPLFCIPSLDFVPLCHNVYKYKFSEFTERNSKWQIIWHSGYWTQSRRKWCQVAPVRVEGGVLHHLLSPMSSFHPADPCDPPGTSRCQQLLSFLLAPPHSSSASRKYVT